MTRLVPLLAALTACATATPPILPPRPAPDGDTRLVGNVTPTSYDIEMTVDPAADHFEGHETITVHLDAPTGEIHLHAQELTIVSATSEGNTGSVETGPNGGMVVRFPAELPAGDHALAISWTGALREQLAGLYRVREDGRFYAFTQFEAQDARRAFPCFDEPGFKTPFTLGLRVPHGLVAASNTPIALTTAEGPTDHVRFGTTRPLPTYLVALAVGPFDVVDAGSEAGVPMRVLTPQGKGALGSLAASRVGPVLHALSTYVGHPYPYEKLDLVAVPAFAFGAMENAGLITFRDVNLLIDPAQASLGQKIGLDSIVAHELAHHWVGDLVTMKWWNDIWLNEGMATFLGSVTVQTLHPQLGRDLDAARSEVDVMFADGQGSSRAVRQPVKDGGDVRNGFDGITYGKGMSVLRMLEAWVGPDAFRRGLSAYLGDHAYASATTDDLLGALEHVSGKPVRKVAATFLDRPGVPLVDVTVTCADRVSAHLTQRRWRPLGSTAPSGDPWAVPVCLGLSGKERACTLLEGPALDVDLAACPTHLRPNDGQTGYYLYRLPDKDLLALADSEAQLPGPEAVTLAGNLDALLMAGEVSPSVHLHAIRRLLASKRRQVVEAALSSTWQVWHLAVEGRPDAEKEFARFVRDALGARGRELGLLPRAGEKEDDELLRPVVVGTLAELGDDPFIKAEATRLANRWLDDPGSVPLPAAQMALPIAVRQGDAALRAKVEAAVARPGSPTGRILALSALGSFRDPKLVSQSLALYFQPDLQASDFWPIAGPASGHPETRDAVLRFVVDHFDELSRKLGDELTARLPRLGASACSAAAKEHLSELFAKDSRLRPGSRRNLAQAIESIETCSAIRTQIATAVDSALQAPRK